MSELINSTPELPKSNRRNKDAVHASCLDLIRTCVSSFAQGKDISYSDVKVKDLYKDQGSDAYNRDCKRIQKELGRLQPWLEAIGIPLPPVEYKEGRLHIPVRGFVARISRDLWNERSQLAKSLVSYRLENGNPLIPHTGTIYLGFGTTILAVAEHLCENLQEFEEISLSTSNIEILIRYYVLAPTIWHKGRFLLPGGGEIDWIHGCVLPLGNEPEISTAIISFEAMDDQGRFYADTSQRRDLIQEVLKKTVRKIILVGEQAKFASSGAYQITLPSNKECEIFLFTNGQPAPKYKKAIKKAIPRGVKFKLIVSEPDPEPDPALSSTNQETNPKKPR